MTPHTDHLIDLIKSCLTGPNQHEPRSGLCLRPDAGIASRPFKELGKIAKLLTCRALRTKKGKGRER